ncbi:MAG: AAA family ATPase, partial [Elusimicrobia bacterium]|nr:AAA family ATPase [Elusimicrobiota bacterium]
MNPNNNVVVIVGPTASGKSAVALELAKKTGGEIVNADSRQIYKHIAFGTSKPTPEEMASAPHHLYDFLEPNVPYSAGDYARDAGNAISGILERRRTPIVVGGTGLYIQSLFDGLAV